MKPMCARIDGKVLAVVSTLLVSWACHDSRTPVWTPPPVASAASDKPVINFFTVEPSATKAGQPSALRWSVTNAASVDIDHDIGQVKSDGNYTAIVEETTTYRLRASNPSGVTEASVTVAVTSKAVAESPRAPASEDSAVTLKSANEKLNDLHFDYNSDQIHEADLSFLHSDAALLKSLLAADSSISVRIQGHCDERGSDEYNIGLSDRRANAVKAALVKLGIPESRLEIIGYGKELPLCAEPTEDCYARNRRAHFSAEHLSARNQ